MNDVASIIFAVMSFIAVIIYLIIYINSIKNPKYRPNLFTWTFWIFADIINTYTYYYVIGKDLWEFLFIISETIGILIIFIFVLFKDKRNNNHQKVLLGTMFIIFFIITTLVDNKNIINLMIQVFYIIGYIFTIIGIRNNKNIESIPSYVWGIVAALLSILSIISNFHGNYVAFVAPIVMILGDLMVIFFMTKKINT